MANILNPVRLGHSEIMVSPLCIGGMSFGKASPEFHQWTIGEKETEAVIGYAFDQGINFIDTANGYAFGTSEEYIGKALLKEEFSPVSGLVRCEAIALMLTTPLPKIAPDERHQQVK